jgi:hypothetical protein
MEEAAAGLVEVGVAFVAAEADDDRKGERS